MTDQKASESSIFDAQGGLSLKGVGIDLSAAAVAELRADFPEVLEELQLYWEAYRAWRESGSAAHDALLEIWHMAEPSDTSYATYGDDTESVVEAVRVALRKHRSELIQKEIEAFELVIDASENLGAEEFAIDSRNTDPQWEAGYRAGAEDLAAHLRQKLEGLRASQAELDSQS